MRVRSKDPPRLTLMTSMPTAMPRTTLEETITSTSQMVLRMAGQKNG